MEQEEQRKQYKRGIRNGIFIGGGIILGISAFVTGFIILVLVAGFKGSSSQNFLIGDDVVKKANSLIYYINGYYLYEYDEEEMENAIYDAIMGSLNDPYAEYYTEEEYEELMEASNGTYYGIGVVVQQDIESGYVVVIQPYENAPGAEAGIRPGDLIVAVEGEDICGVDLDLVVKEIKGEEGTFVNITIVRDGEEFDLEVERRKINVETVSHGMIGNTIGYIEITQFDAITVSQFEEALKELKEQGMESLIVDVRDNPGGRLDAVNDILDNFIDKGDLIVYTEDKNGNREDYRAKKEPTIDVPCVVLVNEYSASASEIFAGALQDYELAHIMGTQSYGKGIVQSILPLADGSAFKLTVEDYYTPLGNNIHGIGITPDTVVELDMDVYLEEERDTQLEAAIEYLTK